MQTDDPFMTPELRAELEWLASHEPLIRYRLQEIARVLRELHGVSSRGAILAIMGTAVTVAAEEAGVPLAEAMASEAVAEVEVQLDPDWWVEPCAMLEREAADPNGSR